jgi:hypothetical protein
MRPGCQVNRSFNSGCFGEYSVISSIRRIVRTLLGSSNGHWFQILHACKELTKCKILQSWHGLLVAKQALFSFYVMHPGDDELVSHILVFSFFRFITIGRSHCRRYINTIMRGLTPAFFKRFLRLLLLIYAPNIPVLLATLE